MRVAQEKVEVFMDKIGDPVALHPEVGVLDDGRRRHRLMDEELKEYREALEQSDLVAVADALGDLVYTVLGTAAHHGIDLTPVFEEVHRSNMTKEPVKGDGFKLCRKGPNFEPPRIADVLLIQSPSFRDVEQPAST